MGHLADTTGLNARSVVAMNPDEVLKDVVLRYLDINSFTAPRPSPGFLGTEYVFPPYFREVGVTKDLKLG